MSSSFNGQNVTRNVILHKGCTAAVNRRRAQGVYSRSQRKNCTRPVQIILETPLGRLNSSLYAIFIFVQFLLIINHFGIGEFQAL